VVRRNLHVPVSQGSTLKGAQKTDADTLLRVAYGITTDSRSIRIGTKQAYLVPGAPGWIFLVWAETSDMIISVNGRDVADQTLIAVARGLAAN
jgi:hypothetical protein